MQAIPGDKAALRGGTADIADLQARLDCAANNLVVLLGMHGGRWKPRTLLQEHDLRELIALWSEVKAALEARRLSPVYGAVRRAISSRINPPLRAIPCHSGSANRLLLQFPIAELGFCRMDWLCQRPRLVVTAVTRQPSGQEPWSVRSR